MERQLKIIINILRFSLVFMLAWATFSIYNTVKEFNTPVAAEDTAPSTEQTSEYTETTLEETAATEPISVISEETMPTGAAETEVQTDASGMPVDSLVEKALSAILKGDKYSMKFSIQMGEGAANQTVPVKASVSGKKTALETSMDMGGQALTVNILSTGTEAYLSIPGNAFQSILPNIPKTTKGYYMKLPNEEFKDFFPDLTTSGSANVKYLGTTKVTYKGVNYICETYSSEGVTTKYYFNNGALKRIEVTDTTGETSILENVELTSTVDEAAFKTPKEKGYLDISGLSSLLGF